MLSWTPPIGNPFRGAGGTIILPILHEHSLENHLATLIRAHLALPLDPVLEVHDESLGQEDGGRARPEAGRPQPLGQAARVGEVGGHTGVVARG